MDYQFLLKKCVNAHDRCAGTSDCPWCEPVVPLRTKDGKFVSAVDLILDEKR